MPSSKRASRLRREARLHATCRLVAKCEREAWDWSGVIPMRVHRVVLRRLATGRYNLKCIYD